MRQFKVRGGWAIVPGTIVNPNAKRLKKWGKGKLYPVEVSRRYNGGIVVEDMNGKPRWVEGFKVGKPKVPRGWELVSIHCGAWEMAKPPVLDMLLKRKERKHGN